MKREAKNAPSTKQKQQELPLIAQDSQISTKEKAPKRKYSKRTKEPKISPKAVAYLSQKSSLTL